MSKNTNVKFMTLLRKSWVNLDMIHQWQQVLEKAVHEDRLTDEETQMIGEFGFTLKEVLTAKQ